MKKYHILLVDPPWEYRDKKKSEQNYLVVTP